MNKKMEREINGPSWSEVILGAVLSLALGVVLAAAFLVFKPVTTARELPKEPAEDVVYYLEGSRDSSKARSAPAKRQAFLQGESVVLVEEELNALAAPVVAASASPGAPAADAAGSSMVSAGATNFRIRDGVLQIGVPVQIRALGLDRRLIVQARGGFAKDGDTFVFEPGELMVGACPLQRVPLVKGILVKRLLASLAAPEDIAAAWRNLSDVAVDGSTLRLER